MRISWLEPEVIRVARARLVAMHPDFDTHFLPRFVPPSAPPGLDDERWPRIAEHVARAERVSQDVREHGLEMAVERYGSSHHAIEVATLIAAALEAESLTYDLLVAVFDCEVDELVAYGGFLDLLQSMGRVERERALSVYERFSEAFAATASKQPMWLDRIRAVRDGLASFYVSCDRLDEGHELFRQRHEEEPDSLLVALSASRAFLSVGAVSRAVSWLGMGAERADELGRPEMAERLRGKQDALRSRQS